MRSALNEVITMKRLSVALLATAFSAFGAGLASAQEGTLERNIMQGVLSGLGIVGEERPPIDYRQRAPLVLPRGTNALPPPQDGTASARNPAWPNDPDLARQRAAGLAARAPIDNGDVQMQRGLTNGEMRSRNNGGLFGGGPVDVTGRQSEQQVSSPATIDEMRVAPIWSTVGSLFGGSNSRDVVVPFPGEAPRRRLVEPPPGYRTASPDAPYGPVGRTINDPQAANNRDREGSQDPARTGGMR